MTPDEIKNTSRRFGVDMSSAEVGKRLQAVSQLRALGLALRKARVLGPAEATPKSQAGEKPG